jgi:hypothetical protein
MRSSGQGITAEVLYQFLILKVLSDNDGKAERSRVLTIIGTKYKTFLSEKDLEEYESGSALRWENQISFAREHLKEQGFLRRDSSWGLWEITDGGRKQLAEWIEMIRSNK